MVSRDDLINLLSKNEAILEFLTRWQQLSKDLLVENEKLRLRIVQLEMQVTDSGAEQVSQLRAENDQLRKRVERIEMRFNEVETENKDFAQRYVDVLEQNQGLSNLYVASHQLHSTLNLDEVVHIIMDIVINLIGAEEFAIYMASDETSELSLIGGELDKRHLRNKTITVGQGVEGGVALTKEIYTGDPSQRPGDVLICVPLTIKDHLIGIISIYKLLPQKRGFTPLDLDLLALLAGDAATALISSKLYQGTQRKLRTAESLINLLRS